MKKREKAFFTMDLHLEVLNKKFIKRSCKNINRIYHTKCAEEEMPILMSLMHSVRIVLINF